ncbi:MAG TPA: hypothetical protein VFB92_11870 [Vicinamibacterales bacterium]|jgi:hypothetical protein|nr:hypothetical protein [Vicinamibacterales bacterium]
MRMSRLAVIVAVCELWCPRDLAAQSLITNARIACARVKGGTVVVDKR